MKDETKLRDFARGEAVAKIHWGADSEEVLELLRANYGIEGEEANAIISDAVSARRSAVRKKAVISLGCAAIGVGISAAYFAIQGFVGFVVIGFGPILMGLLGLASLLMAGRSVFRIFSGEASGPA